MLTKNIWNKKIKLSQGKVVDQRYPNMKRNLEKNCWKKWFQNVSKKHHKRFYIKNEIKLIKITTKNSK